MKKLAYFLPVLALLVAFTGCKGPGKNPAGVHGPGTNVNWVDGEIEGDGALYDEFGRRIDENGNLIDEFGNIIGDGSDGFGDGSDLGPGAYDEGFGDGAGGDGNIGMGNRFEGGAEQRGIFSPVYFSYDDSTVVSASERAKVEMVANHLRQNPNQDIIVEGNCDERGSSEYNLALGERRAMSIRTCLVNYGIDPSRIQTKSYGEEMPAALGHGESAWSQNRRGEFVIYSY